MRKVLSNHQEVAKYWANKAQEKGEGYNMFFNNETIYSYGYHFPIAKHYETKEGNKILFTTRGYSVSTSKHISNTKSAIPCGADVIYCYNPCNPHDEDNLHFAKQGVEYLLKKAIKARQRKNEYISKAHSIYNDFLRLKKLFRVKGKLPAYDFTCQQTGRK